MARGDNPPIGILLTETGGFYWRVYFSENGYVLKTEYSEITTPQEAEAKMTSPKVRWMKLE